ncbi:MAG: hypothetical protein BYD32DRAFT_409561 [Podila humilis]|nr:MAG: hypothetical protein BYD32DRAFT_409561 [Podila humilis]
MPTFALTAISQCTRFVWLCTCIRQEFLETGRVDVAHIRYYMHPLYIFFSFRAETSSDRVQYLSHSVAVVYMHPYCA